MYIPYDLPCIYGNIYHYISSYIFVESNGQYKASRPHSIFANNADPPTQAAENTGQLASSQTLCRWLHNCSRDSIALKVRPWNNTRKIPERVVKGFPVVSINHLQYCGWIPSWFARHVTMILGTRQWTYAHLCSAQCQGANDTLWLCQK